MFLHSIASDGTLPHKRAGLGTFEASGFWLLCPGSSDYSALLRQPAVLYNNTIFGAITTRPDIILSVWGRDNNIINTAVQYLSIRPFNICRRTPRTINILTIYSILPI
ncbi:hypothetical protein TELCIR_14377 [Teladorsagia circumcincta]|uniref:Uncharacterized protein n=1 Tax=Teladorsagia circumcincta TaxID=45464 RepID=A0A2G9U1I1_TELCI|nr:hypothetical protein TELCIR_14377 [Teladorsagia circumcincta]